MHYTLHQLNLLVRDVIETDLADEYWVQAELADCRESHGHCYMELIEKDERGNTPIARASAKCWRSSWNMIRPYFERQTGQPLRAGMKVLLLVHAQFHEAFGFSWIVTDIDPTYTLGDLAKRRQDIIRQLKDEGVFDMQRDLTLSPFAKRIAVISAEQAAGYGDFCHQLANNDYGFPFSVRLFPAVMQGEQTEQSIILALNQVYASVRDGGDGAFDCVVIIRGGGATSDLSGFDTLPLAENVAQFPIPIVTGIGHERDESVLDMVAYTHVKTPTAAAALLIDNLAQTLRRIEEAQTRLTLSVNNSISNMKTRLQKLSTLIPTLAVHQLSNARHRMDLLESRLPMTLERMLMERRHQLMQIETTLKGFDPQLLLSRGYSITLHEGHAITDASMLSPGDELETRVAKGVIYSKVLFSKN